MFRAELTRTLKSAWAWQPTTRAGAGAGVATGRATPSAATARKRRTMPDRTYTAGLRRWAREHGRPHARAAPDRGDALRGAGDAARALLRPRLRPGYHPVHGAHGRD